MKFDFTTVAPEAKTKTWQEIIIDRIDDGKVVPIISNSFTDNLAFGSQADLVEGWASYIQYPLAGQQHDLPRIAQYESVSKADNGRSSDEVRVKEKYLQFLKAALSLMADQDPNVSASKRAELADQARELDVSEIAQRLNYPSLDSGRTNPLLLLAALPLPIYLTTSYHNFLEVALEKARKEPRSEICRWHDGLRSIASVFDQNNYEPTPEQPLVYHFHGLDSYPESLVLTEDDHLDFLANISKDGSAIHPRINRALTESSLVMLGYSLRNWDFRVLFRGIIKPRPQSLRMTNVAIQLEETSLEKEYVKKYLSQVEFEVEWSDTHTFIQELYEGWEG
jgi:hypothetical protein